MNKQDKITLVENLTADLKEAKSVVLVDYMGLTVKSQQELKKELRAVGAEMSVVKNTLFKIAAKNIDAPKELSDTVMEGPSAIVIAKEDPIAPLQVLAKFAKANELPQLKVGIVEGNFQDKASLTKLSTLPSRDVLLGQAVGTIAAPLYGIVSTLQGNIQKLFYVLQAKAKQG
jgi:large subunit ribosomal protein L10